MNTKRTWLYCACVHASFIDETLRGRVAAALAESGETVQVVPDLCRLAARQNPMLQSWAETDSLVIVACFPRAIRNLFQFAGFPLSPERSTFVNLRAEDVESQLAALGITLSERVAPLPPPDPEDAWIPWFPVLDAARCSNCKQCLNFCLFGVYEQDEDGRVFVAHPDQCKNNCPACARICPEAAIVFPKVNDAPINGAPIEDEDAVRATIRVNVDELLGQDVYAALEMRKMKRRRLLKENSAYEQQKKAMEEREHFLKENS